MGGGDGPGKQPSVPMMIKFRSTLSSPSSRKVMKLVTSQFLPISPDQREGQKLRPTLAKGPRYCHWVKSWAWMAYKNVVGVTSRIPPEMIPNSVSASFIPRSFAAHGHAATNGSLQLVTSMPSGSPGKIGLAGIFCHERPLSKDLARASDSEPRTCFRV